MMSKALEILRDLQECEGQPAELYEQIDEAIEELLAQPEQEPDVGDVVEPVAWCQMVEGKVQDLLTSFEMKDWLYDKSWMPLYTAPPKREPLSQVVDSDERASAYMNARLWDFIEIGGAFPKACPDPRIWDHVLIYAPKREPLSEDEIWKGIKAEHPISRSSFTLGVKYAEKAHGIGGEE